MGWSKWDHLTHGETCVVSCRVISFENIFGKDPVPGPDIKGEVGPWGTSTLPFRTISVL